MVCWALPGPVGAATAGAASPMIAAANPLTMVATNPNFLMRIRSLSSSSNQQNDEVSG
jgi:hypothetical protein